MYLGPLDYKKVDGPILQAMRIYYAQRARNTVAYSTREFISWWVANLKRARWKRPHCGRRDHSKGYSFDNIVMQEQADNNRERNSRRGNPCQRRPVKAFGTLLRYIKIFPSVKEAAEYYGVSPKTVWNHCNGRTKNFGKFGPKKSRVAVRFQWK